MSTYLYVLSDSLRLFGTTPVDLRCRMMLGCSKNPFRKGSLRALYSGMIISLRVWLSLKLSSLRLLRAALRRLVLLLIKIMHWK